MSEHILFMPKGRDMEVLHESLSGDVFSHDPLTLRDFMRGREGADYLFVDIGMLEQEFNSLEEGLQCLGTRFAVSEIIVMAPADQIRRVVDALKKGATDYLTYPLTPEEIGLVLNRTRDSLILQSELDYLRDHFWQEDVQDLVGTASPSMREVFSKVRHVAGTRTTVLLTGETGTGKSLLARIIHNHSSRRDRQFISVHCGAIPDTLTESELFGHEKGAFTGAVRRKPGKFELAQGGTLFLDEIGTISQSVQIKLLDVVQERVFQRVGGDRDIKADVRIIAATNEDLQELSARGMFRKDLYFRLNVFPIHVPPLRERREDILRLAELFIKRCNIQLVKEIRGLHPKVLGGFMHYDWPGNVRELENLIERACILEDGDVLGPERFPAECFEGTPGAVSAEVDLTLPIADARRHVVDRFERVYLDRLLAECAGGMKTAADRAGVTTRQLRKLMVRHGVDRKKYIHPSRPA